MCPNCSPCPGLQPEESVGLRAEGHPDSLKDNSSCSVMVRSGPFVSPPPIFLPSPELRLCPTPPACSLQLPIPALCPGLLPAADLYPPTPARPPE